jgi:hypothetical protein
VIFKGFDPGGMDVLPETVAVTIITRIFLSLSKSGPHLTSSPHLSGHSSRVLVVTLSAPVRYPRVELLYGSEHIATSYFLHSYSASFALRRLLFVHYVLLVITPLYFVSASFGVTGESEQRLVQSELEVVSP